MSGYKRRTNLIKENTLFMINITAKQAEDATVATC